MEISRVLVGVDVTWSWSVGGSAVQIWRHTELVGTSTVGLFEIGSEDGMAKVRHKILPERLLLLWLDSAEDAE